MNIQYLRADHFCQSVRDGTHDTPTPCDKGYKLVTGKHIKNGQIDPTNAYYISAEDYEAINARSLVEQWDVLMSMIGTVGEAAVVKEVPKYAIKNVALFKIGGSELKGKWLAYYLNSSFARGNMTGNMKGSSQQFLSLKQLRELMIPFTDFNTMQEIIDILSAYDDLIENNQKQIKLLEEAAQRLYKEWFTDLRFPGHETTPIINGIPEGWEHGSLSTIGKFVRGTTIKKNQTNENGGVPVVAGGLEPAYFHDVANTVAPVITVSGSGANAGYVNIYFENIFASDCSFLDSHAKHLFFCYCTLKNMTQQLDLLQKGAAQPHVYTKDINSLQILLPSNKYLSDFCSTVKPFFDRIGRLGQEKKLLTEARDRLLPKLMSGEIEV